MADYHKTAARQVRGLALVFAVQTAAYLLAVLKLGTILLGVSIVLYGLAVFARVSRAGRP